MIDSQNMFFSVADGKIDILLPEPRTCSRCHRQTCFFRGVEGRILCTDCQDLRATCEK